ncbi:GrpB family protein [Enterococcus sp. AZ072]|uniref:GrpB family protein n=1 Tax=unclassified Enterococcus TaxID=2608891 RepID=UPI003D268288
MKKKLSDMSLKELWQLFPIELSNSRLEWQNYYQEIESKLTDWIPKEQCLRISHIGSTAIKEIKAKNIVDVLVELSPNAVLQSIADILEEHDCIIMSASVNRISLNCGYTPDGFAEKVYHIHLRYIGDNDELYFRDYLNQFPTTAQDYEQLKEVLAVKYRNDRNRYTDEKGSFIKKVTAEAKNFYGEKYGYGKKD